ncbi:MAG: CoA-binding protein [Bacteroidetes bacterium]|nr:CoA-binding protein [Bacteroidota bacterium]
MIDLTNEGTILKTARTIAVLGVKPDPDEVSNEIFRFLMDKGYQVVGVNPRVAGTRIQGRPVYATLADIPHPVDIVDIFRAPAHLPGHVPDLLSMTPRPPVVWFQQGIRNDAVAETLTREGIHVIQDYCILVAHSVNRHIINS